MDSSIEGAILDRFGKWIKKTIPDRPPQAALHSLLFQGMTEAEIDTMMTRASVAVYPARNWLYREGEPEQGLFLVKSGLVRISQMTSSGDDMLVGLAVPGDIFGYFALTNNTRNLNSAHTALPSTLVNWHRDVALDLMQKIPRASLNLFSIAASEVNRFYRRSRALLADSVQNRVSWALGELVRAVGVPTPEGIEIACGIDQRDLAQLAGTTTYSVSRELSKLEAQGVVAKSRGRILVLRPDRLPRYDI